MGQITGSFKLTAVIDGTTYTAKIQRTNSSAPFFQFLNGSTITPDWTKANASHPSFDVVVTNATGAVIPQTAQAQMYYEGVQVSFGTDGKSTNSGLSGTIKRESTSDGKNTHFEIIKNVADPALNKDNDTFYCVATITVNGKSVTIQTSPQTIQIHQTTDSNAYFLDVQGDDIANGEDSTVLTATLYNNGGSSINSGVEYQWYNMTGATADKIQSATAQTYTVNKTEVNGYELFKCEANLSKDKNTKYSAFAQVRDYNDPYYVVLEEVHDSSWASSGYISEGETAKYNVRIVDTDGNHVDAGKTITATVTVLKADGTVLSGKQTTPITLTAQNLGTVTTGQLSFTYQEVVNAGGSVQGYVTGEISSSN